MKKLREEIAELGRFDAEERKKKIEREKELQKLRGLEQGQGRDLDFFGR